MRVLILGGYGTFGSRLARLLADAPQLTLLIAGRSRAKAEALCREIHGSAALVPVACDRDGDLSSFFRAEAVDIVVDATGPFQAYGDRPYRVVEAALAAGASYIDLSDGAAFVADIGRFDAEAKAKGLFVLSGASSFPVLSCAVVRHLTADGARPRSVVAGVAPSPYATIGANVFRAIASYAGKPLALRRDGVDTVGIGLVDHRDMTVAPPGRLPLRRRRFSLVEVPDLSEMPRLWPGLRTAWVGAGTVPHVLHLGLNLLSQLVSLRILPTLAPLGGLFHRSQSLFRWGEDRGGMVVQVTGEAIGGATVLRSWHMVAEGDAGPFIPSMAAEALIRRVMDGRAPEAGARSASRDLELADFAPSMARRAISHAVRDETAEAASASPFQRVLGSAFEGLPPALRALHGTEPHLVARGRAIVERGRGPFAWLAAKTIGFPESAEDAEVEVTFARADGRETWRRTFAGRSFQSVQEAGEGRWLHLLVERFGPAAFAFALVVEAGRLRMVPRGWSLFGVPLPASAGPTAEAVEEVEDGVFRFDVTVGHRLFGRIIRYRGWLRPVDG